MRWLVGTMIVVLWVGVAAADPAVHICMPQTAGIDAAERTAHEDAIRRAMIAAAPDAKAIDVSVSKLSVVIGKDNVEVSAELKVVVSTTDDQIRSFGSGTARFSVARRQHRPERVPALRRQVLLDALDGLHRRMRAAYRRVA
jgi:hypothetical protein